jgi:F-type H+-transporting ATPase subunit delta
MKDIKVARRYAKALFELAIEMKVVEQVYADALLIEDVCERNKDFVLMLHSPIIKDVKKLAILKDIFEKNLNILTYKFLIVITRNKRESIIHDIAEQLVVLYQEFKNIVPVKLTTAIKLDATSKGKILKLLSEKSDATFELTEEVDENVIGGFVLEFDDKQFDASILRQIVNLKKEFEVNLYIKGF